MPYIMPAKSVGLYSLYFNDRKIAGNEIKGLLFRISVIHEKNTTKPHIRIILFIDSETASTRPTDVLSFGLAIAFLSSMGGFFPDTIMPVTIELLIGK